MSSVSRGLRPVIRTRTVLAGLILATLLAFAYMATAAAEDASARDIVISDSSSPLSAGAAGPNFSGTAVTAGSPAATQSGSCTTPNVSIEPSAGGAVTGATTQAALAKAFNPASLGVQAGDSVLFCNIASGTPANTYEPAESGTSGTAVDLSVTPGITIAAFPGQTPTLAADAGGTDYNFFSDTSTQGRNFTLADLTLSQVGATFTGNGGFINISNAVNPGTLILDNVSADGFANAVDGGVVSAENVEVVDSDFGTNAINSATGNGGAIDAAEVAVIDSAFGDQTTAPLGANTAAQNGGAINADDVVVDGSVFEGNDAVLDGGAIAAGGNVEVTGDPSIFLGDAAGASIARDGGAIYANTVEVTNASRFGKTVATPSNGFGLRVTSDGGAIATVNVGSPSGTGCDTNTPTTPCIPGTVDITGAASFGDNVANTAGGAIYAAGGIEVDGSTGVTFTAGTTAAGSLGNEAAGGGAIAVGGLFRGVNVVGPPAIARTCHPASASSIKNLSFTRQLGGAAGGGAIHVLPSASDTTDASKRCAVTITDNTFTANASGAGNGGAIYVGGGNVTTDNTYATNGSATIDNVARTTANGGAVAVGPTGANAVLTDTGSSYTGNVAQTAGGAVWVDEAAAPADVTGASLSITGGTFGSAAAPNQAASGGAIYLDDSAAVATGNGAFVIGNNTYTSNVGTTSGGAIEVNSGAPAVANSTFTNNNNSTTGSGGAVRISAGSSVISGNAFTTNKAGTTSGNGGAIQVTGGTPVIEDNEFTGNTATGTGGGNGGAIFTNVALGVAPGLLSENEFLSNAASTAGGAIAHTTAGNLTIFDSLFEQNYAGTGGAVSSATGNLEMNGAEFALNGSQGDGGAVLGTGADTSIINTEFADNKAGVNSAGTYVVAGNASDGGAVKIGTGGTYMINDSLFVGNEAANNGGAVDSASNGSGGADGIIESGFAENEAGKANAAQASTGGAVNLTTAANNVFDSEFVDNTVAQTNVNPAAVTRGGGIAATGAALTITRSTVAGNSVSSAAVPTTPATDPPVAAGGGVYMASANTVTSVNSTFTENNAPVASVAWLEGNSTLTFTSSTIAGNGGPLAAPMIVAGSTTGTLAIGNSILAQGVGAGSACSANTLTNVGGNVLTDTTACGNNTFVGTNGGPAAKVTAAALDLKPLADNGGPTDTMAIGLDSIARATAGVNLLGGTPTDQRELPRPTTNQSSGAYQLTITTLTVSKSGDGTGTVASDPAGIDCGPGCQSQTSEFAATPPSTLVTLTATPEAGSEFQSWTGNCVEIAGNVCVVDADNVNNITANFSTNLRRLTVSVVGNGEGKVTSSPAGIDCGTACEGDFDLGTTVTLTAAASGQSAFAGWGGACASAGTSATCQVTMDQARSATATFTQNALVKIVKVKQGTIRVPGNRTISVGRVECVNGTCNIAQATARVRVRGVTYRASVKGQSGSFTTGQSRTVKVVVPKAAYRNLRTKKSGSVTLVLRATAEVPGQSPVERNKNISNGLRR